MLAAEQSGTFQYKREMSNVSGVEVKPIDTMADRLHDLVISPTENDKGTIPVMVPTPIVAPEKVTKPTSSSRPLTVDEDDLDLDIEIDDSIDTTVSLIIIL